MVKYIVSTEDSKDGFVHGNVKLARVAGAKVEVWSVTRREWMKPNNNPPLFTTVEKYRAIVTDDMPKEIQDMVNYIGDLPVSCAMQELGRGCRTTEPQPHKWKDVIIAMANGVAVEFEDDGLWFTPLKESPLSQPHWNWRIKPRTIMIGDMEVSEPLRTPPEDGTKCFVASIFQGPSSFTWGHALYQGHWLQRGMIHLDRDAAIEHGKALIKVSGGVV